MTTELSLVFASCPLRGECNWWTSDVGPSPLFIWGVFLGLIGLVFLVNFLRSKE